MLYKASCQCGKVTFEMDGEIDNALACNFSTCFRNGSLPWVFPRAAINLRYMEGIDLDVSLPTISTGGHP